MSGADCHEETEEVNRGGDDNNNGGFRTVCPSRPGNTSRREPR